MGQHPNPFNQCNNFNPPSYLDKRVKWVVFGLVDTANPNAKHAVVVFEGWGFMTR